MTILSRARTRLSPSITIGFIIGAVVLLVVGVLSLVGTLRERSEERWVEHTYQVVRVLDHLNSSLELEDSASVSARRRRELDSVQVLTADNPLQQERLAPLRADLDSAPAAARRIVQQMLTTERALRDARERRTDESADLSTVAVVLTTLLAVMFMALALRRLRTDLRRRHAAELALQDSESKYRALVEQAADAILIVDSQAVCVEANACAVDIIGRPREEIRGLPLRDFVVEIGTNIPARLPMLRFGQVATDEFEVVRPDGSRVPVETRATLLDDGRIQVISRDISERREVERLKDQFVSMVSHELRTPLTSIRGALGLLAAGRLDDAPEKRRRMLELAASNSDRLIRLINDILDVERIEAGGVAFERRDCDALEIVTQAIDALRPLGERAGVPLRVTAREHLTVWADPDRLTQTVTNLVGNAIKFSPRGASVDVAVYRDDRMAIFEIRDHGRGIPPDKLGLIFERFQQVDASDAREKGGSGLGLAISRAIVEKHGGRITVESEPDVGSTFRFTIPLVETEVRRRAHAEAPCVLVCDDDRDLLEVLHATLDERGFRVDVATDSATAIKCFDQSHPVVTIVDLRLPHGSGIDVIKHIAAQEFRGRALVYTAVYVDREERELIRAAGAPLISKGHVTPDQLVDEVVKIAVPRTSEAAVS